MKDIRHLYPRITDTHLRILQKWGLINAAPRGVAREFSFTEVATIRQLASELERGAPLKTVLRGLLAEHQGQLELDFHASGTAPAKVVTLPARPKERPSDRAQTPVVIGTAFPFSDPQAALAAKYFIEGSRLDDGDDRNAEGAAAAYRKALVIDPDLVPAIVNLANIHYGHDELIEAQALYERAIALDPDCFEAHFNLGNIHHDLGRYEEALVCYRDAVALNPSYPDAHFYLAVTLEKTGHSPEAKPHWKSYQDLAPNGEWVELAREFSE
ncbi:MAG TPA: tetratricopeptide repeat protein [Vicinamibacterales bacterium]